MPKAAIFDVDGTLLDSVDLHALAWHEAMVKFGHDVGFEQVKGQIGKGGDKLIPIFLSAAEQRDHGAEMEEWRGNRFKSEYLPLVRPFSAVPDLLRRVKDAGVRIAVASSAKKDELDKIIATTEKEEKHFNKLSAEAREKVEPRLLHSYDRIRGNYRNGLAVVPVVRDACGGCFNAIPPQRQSEIRQRKKIIVCENCGRILVDNELNDGIEVK